MIHKNYQQQVLTNINLDDLQRTLESKSHTRTFMQPLLQLANLSYVAKVSITQ